MVQPRWLFDRAGIGAESFRATGGNWLLASLGMIAFAVSMIVFRGAPAEPPPLPQPVVQSNPRVEQPRPRTDQLLAYWTMGGQRRADQMHSALLRLDLGWREWVIQELQQDLDAGFRRVLIHLPFGKDTERDPFMSFDAYLHAQQRGLDQLWRGFARALRPVVDGKYTDGERVQVICYLGSLKHDPDFVRLLDDPTRRDNWLWRVWRSLQPVLDAGCEVAFDTAGTWKPDDPEYWLVGMMHAMGAGGWIEGTEYGFVHVFGQPPVGPLEFHGHLKHLPVVANHNHYWNNIADIEHGGRRPVLGHRWAQVEPGRPVVLLLNGHSAPRNPDGTKKPLAEIWETFPEWAPPMAQRDVAAGFSVAVSVRMMRAHDMTPEQLLAAKESTP